METQALYTCDQVSNSCLITSYKCRHPVLESSSPVTNIFIQYILFLSLVTSRYNDNGNEIFR